MQRKTSPILHDYQVTATRTDAASRRLRWPWFAAGLGVPLCAVAMILSGGEKAPPEDTTTDTATDSTPATLIAASLPATHAPETLPTDEFAQSQSNADAMLTTLLAEAPAAQPAPVAQQAVLEIARGDTLDELFREHGLNIGDLITISKLDAAKEPLRMLKPGDMLTVAHNADGRVLSLTRNLGIHQKLEVSKLDSGFAAELVDRPVEYKRVVKHGNIDSSLFESAMEMGLSDRVVMNVAGIFAWDIDFVYDIRRGDSYYVLYEEVWQDGAKVEDGEIVAAEFINQGNSYKAVRYQSPDGTTDDYFDDSGRSVRKAFVRAPVDFRRISDNFNPNRRHPVLNTIRAHRGVDYAAATGTPIMAAGDGKIIFRGTQRGYGNVVILQHGGNITTLYAHMSNFRKGQRVGSRVKQGQTIGFVGKTGLVTGPHLHYEYRLNGVHRNPRTVALPQAEPIKAEYRDDFERTTTPILAELDQYKKRLQVASSDDTPTTL